MRKFSLALLALLMVAAMASAEPIGTEWTIEAEASATFGVNLDGLTTSAVPGGPADGPTTGFSLANDIDIEIEFIEEQDKEFGEGQMYGYIKIEELKLIMEADGSEETGPAFGGDNGEITAKVFLGPAYIVIATAENDINEAETKIGVDETILGLGDALSEGNEGASVALGFDVATTNIELVIASLGNDVDGDGSTANDWSDNVWNNYKGAILTETEIDALTITLDLAAALRGVGSTTDVNDPEEQGDFGDDGFIGLGVKYEMPLDDMMTLVPFVGLDLFNDKGAGDTDSSTSGREGGFDYEVVVGANVEWGADDLEVFDADGNDDTQAGVGLEVGLGNDVQAGDDTSKSYMWVRAGLAEDGGDDGLFPVIGAAVLFEYYTETQTTAGTDVDKSKVAFGAEIDADLGEISPFFGVMYGDTDMDTDNKDGVDSEGLTMKVGTDIEIIPATTFTLEYSSGNLLNSQDDPVYDATGTYVYEAARGETTNSAGTFTIKTKVEY